MPMRTAQADVFRDWDAVLGACAQNAGLILGVDPLKTDLEGFLAQAKELKIQQETLEAQRQAVTQKLDKVFEDGREAMRKIKAFVVIRLGSDNKALEQFGVKARRGTGPRKARIRAKAKGAPPPTVETAENPPQSQQHNPAVSTQGKEETHA